MKAMVLAAGLGTRLRPMTDSRPKALVELQGRALLEITLLRLRSFGIQDVVINVHHFAEMIIAYLREQQFFGMNIAISNERELLDTGGGLKNAASFFADCDGPFVLHNVDVLSNFDLRAMLQQHCQQQRLATLAVQNRPNARPLLFDSAGELRGYRAPGRADALAPSANAQELKPLAFAGIHILSPAIFQKLSEDGAFPIIPAYLRLAAAGERVRGFRDDAAYWRDLGTLASLEQAEAELRARPELVPNR